MLKLVKMDEKYIPLLNEMMDEWTNTNEKIVPWSIGKCDYHNIGEYIESLEIKESFGKYVPDTTFFCLDTDRNLFIGAVNIRHYLNEDLASGGGHVGAGIRPGERGKGYGTKMLSLALEECAKLDLKNVLVCCDKSNLSSARIIMKNGGVLENEITDGNTLMQRYWIALPAKHPA